MSKKKMYGLLLFMIFSFTIFGFVVTSDLSNFLNNTDNKSFDEQLENKDSDSHENPNNSNGSTIGPTIVADNGDPNDTKDQNNNDVEKDDSSQEVINTNPHSEENDIDKSDKETTLVFTGDVYLSDSIINRYTADGLDGIMSKDLQKEFNQADIAMINQEFAFSNRGTPMEDKQYTFRVDPKYVKIFNEMNVDIVSLANNHSLDYGYDALQDTFNTLKEGNIEYVGAGNNLEEAKETKYFEVNGKTIAILGASRVIPVPEWNAYKDKPGLFTTYDPTRLIDEIKAAEEKSDFSVVFVHWGVERTDNLEEYQPTMAKQYIDAGADLVVGCHPHVLQGIEYYKDKPIVYSLGNYMFRNTIDRTAILKVIINQKNEVSLQLLPCKAYNASVYIVDDMDYRNKFFKYMTDISFDVNFDKEGYIMSN